MNQLKYKLKYESPEFCEKESPGAVLGAMYTPEDTWFRVWVPDADSVSLKLYSCGTADEKQPDGGFLRIIPMEPSRRPGESFVWEVSVYGNLHGIYYTYEVCRGSERLECIDIYAKACGANGKRGMIIDLALTDPEGWEGDGRWRQNNENTVIYELHVKDFSYHQDSGIPPEHRGKYLAFTDKTHKRRGVEYLKHLGISHVHLLPVFDFASVDENGDSDQYNWGYDPQNYNIPEGSYSTDARRGEVRIREFKQMVQAFHQAGIGVIMDVVYNHTYSLDCSFQVLAPYYYYRQKENGSLSDGSACGNETASERPMCGKFIRESVLYWAQEYHIDGFRFDLMGLHDTNTLNRIGQELKERLPEKKILLYGEPWTAAKSAMAKGYVPAVKANLHKLAGIAVFSDDTRDAVKGSVFLGKEPGFVNGARDMEQRIASAYLAWCDGGHDFKPIGPKQIISYVSVHDNYTLWDKLVLTEGSMEEKYSMEEEHSMDFISKREEILNMNKLAAGIIFTCLGTPLFQAGEEFGRTKYGDENSYRSSASINCLDWSRRDEFEDLVEYYRGLIALRGIIPLYHSQSGKTVNEVHILHAHGGKVVVGLDLTKYESRWKKIYIIANASSRTYETILPQGSYQKLADSKSAWLWKKNFLWNKNRKGSNKMFTAPKSMGIWGLLK